MKIAEIKTKMLEKVKIAKPLKKQIARFTQKYLKFYFDEKDFRITFKPWKTPQSSNALRIQMMRGDTGIRVFWQYHEATKYIIDFTNDHFYVYKYDWYPKRKLFCAKYNIEDCKLISVKSFAQHISQPWKSCRPCDSVLYETYCLLKRQVETYCQRKDLVATRIYKPFHPSCPKNYYSYLLENIVARMKRKPMRRNPYIESDELCFYYYVAALPDSVLEIIKSYLLCLFHGFLFRTFLAHIEMEWTKTNPLWNALCQISKVTPRAEFPMKNSISFEPWVNPDMLYLTLDDAQLSGKLSELGQVFFEKLLVALNLKKQDIGYITIIQHDQQATSVEVFLEATGTLIGNTIIAGNFIPMTMDSVLDFIGLRGQLLGALRHVSGGHGFGFGQGKK